MVGGSLNNSGENERMGRNGHIRKIFDIKLTGIKVKLKYKVDKERRIKNGLAK